MNDSSTKFLNAPLTLPCGLVLPNRLAKAAMTEGLAGPVIVGARDLYHKGYWGVLGGVGADYNLGNVRLVLDIRYQAGISNITNTSNRFSNDRLSGIGDALDDMKLNNIVISGGVLFPLRFLGTGFKTLDR